MIMFRSVLYDDPGYRGERLPAWTSRTPPPPLLSVSREAREVALKTWKLSFAYEVFPAAVVSSLSSLCLDMLSWFRDD